MRLACEELETRDTLSAYAVGGGVVHVRTGWEVYAFEDWRGDLNVAAGVFDGRPAVYVGPAVGGAPREVVFDVTTGATLADFFAGDPSLRTGLTFAPVPTGTPVPVPNAHAIAGAPGGLFVFEDFEDGRGIEEQRAVVAETAAYFAGLPVQVGTDRPNANPLTYATVVIGADPSWASPAAAGEAPIGGFRGGVPAEVAAGLGDRLTGAVAAHELGHLLGLQHSPDVNDLMYEVAGLNRHLSAAEEANVLHTLTGA